VTSFVLAQTVFHLFYGQVLRIFPAEWVLVWYVTIFETGSLVCAVAQNVNQLIVGRTISRMGAAGICTSFVLFNYVSLPNNGDKTVVSMIQTIAQVTRLEDRPRLFVMFGAVFAIIDPLIGDTFRDHFIIPSSVSALPTDFSRTR
jgi:MFS family permease